MRELAEGHEHVDDVTGAATDDAVPFLRMVAELTHFAYRSAQPLYAGRRCTLAVKLGEGGNDARLWAEGEAGVVVQTGSLTLARPIHG